MMDTTQIESIVYAAIDRVNEVQLDDSVIPKDPGTLLMGSGAALDSMGFINFIVAVEEGLSEQSGLALNLVEQLNAPGGDAPKAARVEDFVEFVSQLVAASS